MKNTDFELSQLNRLFSGDASDALQELIRDMDLVVTSFKVA